jgi:hypothetical protein
MGVGGQSHAPAALPPGKTRCPLYRSMMGPSGLSGRVRKISPPPGFDPRAVQLVASCYTDYAIPLPPPPPDEGKSSSNTNDASLLQDSPVLHSQSPDGYEKSSKRLTYKIDPGIEQR